MTEAMASIRLRQSGHLAGEIDDLWIGIDVLERIVEGMEGAPLPECDRSTLHRGLGPRILAAAGHPGVAGQRCRVRSAT